MKNSFLLSVLLAIGLSVNGQSTGDYRSHQTGNWNSTSSWDRFDGSAWVNPAPSTPNTVSGEIRIRALHSITITASLSADQILVDSAGTVIVNSGRTLSVVSNPGLVIYGTLSLSGTLNTLSGSTTVGIGGMVIRQQGASVNSTVSTLEFMAGSSFEHRATSPSTALSLAKFDPNSNLLISGFTGGGTMNSTNWSVPLGNVIYDCSNQGSGSVNFSGFIKRVEGSLEIRNTGLTGRVYFNSADTSSTQNGAPITISKGLSITGLSRVFLTSTGIVETHIGGDFLFNPSSTAGASQCATTGAGTLDVAGRADLTSATWDLSASSGGTGSLNFHGDVVISGATLTRSGGGTTKGNINLVGSSLQNLDPTGISSTATNLNLIINNDSGVRLTRSFTFAGTLSLSAGTLLLNNNILVLNGPLEALQGVFAADSTGEAILKIGGSGSLPDDIGIQSGVFSGIELNRPGSKFATTSYFGIRGTLSVLSGTFLSKNGIDFSGVSSIEGGGSLYFNDISVSENGSLTSSESFTISGIVRNDGTINFQSCTSTFDGLSGAIDGQSSSTFLSTVEIDSGSSIAINVPITIADGLNVNGSLTCNRQFSSSGPITVSAGGSMQIYQPSLMRKTLTVSSGGSFEALAGADLIISGNLSVNGNFASNARVTFDGVTTMTGTGTKIFRDLSINGTFTPNGAYSITGNLELTENGVLFPGNNTTTFAGINSVFSNSGNGVATFNRLTIAVGTKLTTDTPLVCNGTLTVRGSFVSNAVLIARGSCRVSAGTGNFAANNGASVAGTLTVSSNAAFTCYPGSNLTVAGNLSVTGTLISSDTTFFNGKTIITGSGSKSFNHIVINGTVTPNSSHRIGGNLRVNGTLEPGSNTTTFEGVTAISGNGTVSFNNIQLLPSAILTASPGTISITGNLADNGLFIHNHGSVVFAGNTSKSVLRQDQNPIDFFNMGIIGGSSDTDLVSESDINLFGILNLYGAATFDADGAGGNHVFVLRSAGDDPAIDASIGVMPDSAAITGRLQVERFMSGEGRIYRYLCSPLKGATVAMWQNTFPITGTFVNPSAEALICGRRVKPSSPSMYYYDEATKRYVAYPFAGIAEENPIPVGRGFAVFIRECKNSLVADTQGFLERGVNLGKVIVPITHTGTVTDYNNLVGNPYPSGIFWDSAHLSNVSATIAVRDNGSGNFRYYTQGGSGASDIPDGVIAQGQAFWIRTTGPNPELVFTENAKISQPQGTFYRKKSADRIEITLTGSTQLQTDKTYIIRDDDASSSDVLDKVDAPKLNNQLDDPFVELFDLFTTTSSGRHLAVNAIPRIGCSTSIPLAIDDAGVGSYTFSFTKSGYFAGIPVSILDRFSGTTTPVEVSFKYDFRIEENIASRSGTRFLLVFGPESIRLDSPIHADSIVCLDRPVKVEVGNTQPGMLYFAQIDARTASDTIVGTGFDDWLYIPFGRVPAGLVNIDILVSGGCESRTMENQLVIRKVNLRMPLAKSGYRCGPGIVRFKEPGDTNISYTWYDGMDSRKPLHQGNEFSTPSLNRTTKYYVASVDSSGHCESNRLEVVANVIAINEARITRIDDWTLRSNSDDRNSWFLDELRLPDTSSILKISGPGNYKLVVKKDSCSSTDELHVDEVETPDDVVMFPNPVRDWLSIEVKSADLDAKAEVFNFLAEQVGTIPMQPKDGGMKGYFNFENLATGLYYIVTNPKGRQHVTSVIKN